MRYALILIAALGVSCGGGATPTAPSPSPSPAPAPAPAPTPAPAPAPQFPSMTGGWGGTRSITLVERGGFNQRDSNTCTETWIVTTQTAGRVSGTFQSSGGTTSTCSTSGTMAGDVSTSGALTGLTFTSPAPGGPTTCTRVSGDGTFAGVVSNASAATAQSADVQRCTTVLPSLTTTAEWDRTIVLSMNKR